MSVHMFCCFLSRCTIATHLACQLLRMPWSTLTHISSSESVLWLYFFFLPGSTEHALTDATVSVKSEQKEKSFACNNTPLCTLMKNLAFGFSSLDSVDCFQKEIAHFECKRRSRENRQTDSVRGGMLRIPATPCSVYIICVTLMNYG